MVGIDRHADSAHTALNGEAQVSGRPGATVVRAAVARCQVALAIDAEQVGGVVVRNHGGRVQIRERVVAEFCGLWKKHPRSGVDAAVVQVTFPDSGSPNGFVVFPFHRSESGEEQALCVFAEAGGAEHCCHVLLRQGVGQINVAFLPFGSVGRRHDAAVVCGESIETVACSSKDEGGLGISVQVCPAVFPVVGDDGASLCHGKESSVVNGDGADVNRCRTEGLHRFGSGEVRVGAVGDDDLGAAVRSPII